MDNRHASRSPGSADAASIGMPKLIVDLEGKCELVEGYDSRLMGCIS